MNNAQTLLLWCGGAGWFLLSFLLALSRCPSAASAVVWTVFYWLISMDAVYTILGSIVTVLAKTSFGWRFVAGFVVLPYLLGLLRARWLWRRHLTARR